MFVNEHFAISNNRRTVHPRISKESGAAAGSNVSRLSVNELWQGVPSGFLHGPPHLLTLYLSTLCWCVCVCARCLMNEPAHDGFSRRDSTPAIHDADHRTRSNGRSSSDFLIPIHLYVYLAAG